MGALRHLNENTIAESPHGSQLYGLFLAGSYDEVCSIQKSTTASDTRLPTNRHAGYIVIGFKLLDEPSKVVHVELSVGVARELESVRITKKVETLKYAVYTDRICKTIIR